MNIIWTDHTGRDQHYATVGQGVLGLGPEGTMRQARAWLNNLYHGRPERQTVAASVRIEDAAKKDAYRLMCELADECVALEVAIRYACANEIQALRAARS